MIPLKHLRRALTASARCLGLVGLRVVVLAAASMPVQAATVPSETSGDVIQIDPNPLFDEGDLRRLIEKPAITFTADPPRIGKGGSSTLSWHVENAETVTISSIGGVGADGTRAVSPTEKTTYTLTAKGRNATVSKSVTVDVTELATVVGTVHVIRPVERVNVERVRTIRTVLTLENVAFDFVAQANKAAWESSSKLQFGGASGVKGWARVVQSVRAEDGKDYPNVLQVQPELKSNGAVIGTYAVEGLPPNARFTATVGFTANHGSQDGATLVVLVFGKPPGQPTPVYLPVASQKITRDGKLDTITADLGGYAGQTVVIRLVTSADNQFQDDLVLWIAPRILK
jgi:hypothetical protein